LAAEHLPKRNYGLRDPACDAIPNALLAEMCNGDLPYLDGVSASDIASVSGSTAETYNLATGVNIFATLDQVDSDIVMTLNISLENWNLVDSPLVLSVETRWASSSDLSSYTNWEHFEIFPQDYSTQPIVSSILFTPASACTTYDVRAQVISVATNYTTPFISASVATDGSCYSAVIEANAVIESNDLPAPEDFVEVSPVDPDPVTTQAPPVTSSPFQFTTSPISTAPVTTKLITTRAVTSRGDLTTESLTTGNDFTTKAVTSAAVTSHAVTSGVDVTTKAVTSGAVTSHALTTDFSSVASRCATYSFTTVQAYFCSADQKGYYQCLSGAYSSQSRYGTCATGTFCRCAAGVECSDRGVCTF